MYKNLLPIGSIVLLKGGEKRLMICSRVVVGGEENQIYDYAGCYYPEGVVNSSQMFFFHQDAIEDVFFIGFQDREEILFKKNVLAVLDEGTVVVENNQIVVKEKMSGSNE